jgi:hypothetical protein
MDLNLFRVFCVLFFMFAVAVKGGWLGRIPGWNEFKKRKTTNNTPGNILAALKRWLLDGTQLSAFLVTGFMAAATSDVILAVSFGLMWWLYFMRSMGEVAGAVGDYKGGWGEYTVTDKFSRTEGIKNALTHGLAGGGMLTFATGFIWFIPAAGLFPVCYFVGNSLHQFIHKSTGWTYSEPIYGLPIGIAAAFYLTGGF